MLHNYMTSFKHSYWEAIEWLSTHSIHPVTAPAALSYANLEKLPEVLHESKKKKERSNRQGITTDTIRADGKHVEEQEK